MTRLRNKLQAILALVVCCITFFVNNPVITPDIMESRNIIAAREMVYEGHWLVPTMNGALRLEKPPLPTWLTAVAEIISPDSLALQRGMAGLAALLLVLYFWRFARDVLHTKPLVPTLLLCTCYNVVLMGRTASWDIYCHAFMMGGIYHLARALASSPCAWRHFLMAGLWTGLSILSKGPVSVYALFLPFLMSYGFYIRPSWKGKWGGVAVMTVVALVVGLWWYAYIYGVEGTAFSAVAQKESGSWMDHNVRPWWYYWKFFLETGVWSLLLLTAMFLPMASKARRKSADWLFPMGWMLASLLLLSLMPEKKSRYLLPLLIPASYLMGYLIAEWRRVFHAESESSRADRVCFRVNTGLVALVVAVLPVLAWWFIVRPGYATWMAWSLFTLFVEGLAAFLVQATVRLRPMRLVGGVALLFAVAECFLLPVLGKIINNPDMKSIAETRDIRQLDGLQFYHLPSEPLRIELVYAAHRSIVPMSLDSVKGKVPCVLLTRHPLGEEMPKAELEQMKTRFIGRYDDNRRPKSNRRYSGDFIYYVTLLEGKGM